MQQYGQIIDDFDTPSGRYIVVWDLADEQSWYGLVQDKLEGAIGSLLAFERSADGKSVSIRVIEQDELPRALHPLLAPPSEVGNAAGNAKSSLLLVHASA